MKTAQKLPRYAVCYLMCSLLTLFVLGMDTYFNMEEYKCFAFVSVCVITALLFLAGRILSKGSHIVKDAALSWCVAYGVACILSQVGALDQENSLFGRNGYYMGTLFLLASLVVWYLLRSVGDRQMAQWGMGLFLVSGLMADVLGILNMYGVDPLGVVGQLQDFQQGEYFTTIGQMNFVALMLTMWLALAVGSFLFSPQKITVWGNLFRLLCCGMGFWGMVLFDSDNYLLGMCALLLGIFLLPPFDTRVLQRLSLLGAVFFVGAAVGVAMTNWYPTARSLPLVSVAGIPQVALLGMVMSVGVFVALYRWHQKHAPKSLAFVGRRFVIGVVVLGVVIVAWSTLERSGGALAKFLSFDEDWGTHRGACWIALSRIFWNSSWLRKLFGYGASATHQLLMTHSEAWEGIAYDLSGFYAAHNEYLELLVSSGLFGLITWLGFVGVQLKKVFGQVTCDPLAIPLALAVFSSGVESFVNIRTCMVFPVFVVLLGLLAACLREQQPEPLPTKAMAKEIGVVMLMALLTSLLWQEVQLLSGG